MGVCVFILVSVIRMHCACALLSSVAYPAVTYFSTLCHKLHDFRAGGIIDYKKCVCHFFPTIFVRKKIFLFIEN